MSVAQADADGTRKFGMIAGRANVSLFVLADGEQGNGILSATGVKSLPRWGCSPSIARAAPR